MTQSSTLSSMFGRGYRSDADVEYDAMQTHLERYEDTQLSIPLPPKIPLKSGELAKGNFSKQYRSPILVDCFVASEHWMKLDVKSTQSKVNLFDYLPQLIGQNSDCIGLITFQNGIANSYEDFRKMGASIISHLPQVILCIGLYNPSQGVVQDAINLGNELELPNDTQIVGETRQMFINIIDHFLRLKIKARWIHIAHSKAGFIANLAIRGIQDKRGQSPSDSRIKFMKEQLIVSTFGAVMPIARKFVREAYNVYSEADKAAGGFGKAYIKDKDYDIVFVKSREKEIVKNQFEGDHAFIAETYKFHLHEFLINYRFYD
ncbi:MAG: hypothetical protein LLG04_05260 [Parachlamydia sp.]|nr:hypothetical protein [Parachlamydia sp.]